MLAIISTVGQSVFTQGDSSIKDALASFSREAGKKLPLASLDEIIQKEQGFSGRDLYDLAIGNLRSKASNLSALRRTSAEINSLEGIISKSGVREGHAFHFIASETPEGVLAARVLRDFCREYFNALESKVYKIQGLQVDVAKKFRLTGLPELIKRIYEILSATEQRRLKPVLNPTGGFKAVVPYLTMIGMLRKIEISYLYEFSSELLTLGFMPISLDFQGLIPLYPVLEACDSNQQQGYSEAELKEQLGLGSNEAVEGHEMWSLFERYDQGHYILSGLGSIVLNELKVSQAKKRIYLSRQAALRFDALDKGSDSFRNYVRIFNSLHDKDWRDDGHRHEYKGCDFPAIKLVRQNERLFYYEAEDHILVLELALHNPDGSYDKVPQKLSDYDRFRLWEGNN